MPTTDELIAWDRAHLWHPFTPMKPWIEQKDFIVIERAEAEFLFDTDGRKYIDGTSSIWCNVHGHCVPEIDRAVVEQLGKVAHTTLLGMGNVPSILLAKKLAELANHCGMNLPRVFYSDDGSTAVEVAIKMAWQYSKIKGKSPTHFLKLHNAYHGDTMGAVSVGGIGTFHDTFHGLRFPTDYADITTLEARMSNSAEKYCAIIVEPLIQGAGGMLIHPPGMLRKLRELCDRFEILLIADEVMTGFGRTGKMFACEHENVTPDLLCLSKGLTAGYMPLGVTMSSPKIFGAFYADPREMKTFFHGHTFTGHPLACAAALASLELFEKNRTLAHVGAMEEILGEMLAKSRQLPFVHDARQLGLIGAIELREKDGAPFDFHWRVGGALCRLMRDLKPTGLIIRPLGDVIVIMPPLAISENSMRYLCTGVLESLKSVSGIVDAKRGMAEQERRS